MMRLIQCSSVILHLGCNRHGLETLIGQVAHRPSVNHFFFAALVSLN